ncbi:hypothetical protein V6Z11_D10G155600 [Gossypium hirsutum]
MKQNFLKPKQSPRSPHFTTYLLLRQNKHLHQCQIESLVSTISQSSSNESGTSSIQYRGSS